MKFTIVVLAALLVAQEVSGQANAVSKPKEMQQCQTELGVTDDEVTEYLDKNSKPYTTKIKCFLKCLAEKFGLFKDGKLVESKVLADIKENSKHIPANFEKEMKVYNECKDKSGSDACETAAAIYKCVVSAAKTSMEQKS